MTSFRFYVHILAQLVGGPLILTTIPHPWNVVIGVAWAALGAGIAFLDNSLSTQQ